MNSSPYAPPLATVADNVDISGAEAIRRAHLRHEIQLKSVGTLYYFGSVMTLIGMVGVFAAAMMGNAPLPTVAIAIGALYAALAVGGFFIGYGFRHLRPWVRIPATILSALGLLAIPLGTLINGWILFLIYGKQGAVVLSPAYQDVIAATPQVKYQRSVGDWIAVGILVAILLFFVVIFVASLMR